MADPKLLEACKIWDKITQELQRRGRYIGEDYESLECRIEDGKAELRVGSSPGHKTHIDLQEGTVEYYDTDDPVSLAIMTLLEDLELECKHFPAEGIKCSGVTSENVKEVFKILAYATSMDYRLEYPSEYWEDEYLEKCGEKEREVPEEICRIKLDLKTLSQ